MSLAAISGKVSSITNGSGIANYVSKAVFGNSSFLRNDERGVDKIASAISNIQDILTDLSSAAGVKNNMYVIGRYEEESEANNFFERIGQQGQQYVTRAISYWTEGTQAQTGVIIDGFDSFKGDISVALPDNPVMYDTSVSDQVVRNPNRISMRVYVDLMHSDDLVQNVLQSFANSFAGLSGTIMNAITGEKLNRAQKALNNLQWIQEFGNPFKVYTPHKVYDNMMIEKIAPINDQKMNEILAADIVFKEIIPTRSLGYKDKTAARKAPSAYSSALTKALGWVSK